MNIHIVHIGLVVGARGRSLSPLPCVRIILLLMSPLHCVVALTHDTGSSLCGYTVLDRTVLVKNRDACASRSRAGSSTRNYPVADVRRRSVCYQIAVDPELASWRSDVRVTLTDDVGKVSDRGKP